jgi:glycosyltransferase involved in cell wall biosynthesis
MRGMMGGAHVVVIVPAYDEAPRIGAVLRSMPAFVDHVLVVDDASRDDTVARARALEGVDARIEVIRHGINRGVGAAITTGYRRALAITSAPGDAFAVMAGDGQMDPADLRAVLEPIVLGRADYAKGNRFAFRDGAASMPAARRAGGLAFSWLTARATGLTISDSQCGYTAIRRTACLELDLDDLWPRFGYPNDLLGQVASRRLRVAEVPVRAVYGTEKSKLRLRHLPTIGALVVRAWLRRLATERRVERDPPARAPRQKLPANDAPA